MELPQDVRDRLDREIVIWMTTVTPDGRPQSSPVWYLWQDGRFVVYSLADAPRVRNVRANPQVGLHLNATVDGGDVVVFEGVAALEDGPPSTELPDYLARYREHIAGNGWTPERFSRDYPQRIVITPTRIRAYS